MQLKPYTPDRQLYFLHIPKTAGTTLRVLLENRFHVDEICPAYDFLSLTAYPANELMEFRFFRGHMGYNLVNYLPERPYTLLMLRDPVKRTISHFEYIKRDPAHPRHRQIHERNLDLQSFLEDPALRIELENSQTKPLSHNQSRERLIELSSSSSSMIEFQEKWRRLNKGMSGQDMLELALARIEDIEFTGITERFDESLELVSWLTGLVPQERVQRLNTGSSPAGESALRQDTIDLIRESTRLDRELYDRACRIFTERYAKTAALRASGRHALPGSRQKVEKGNLIIDFAGPIRGTGWHQRELDQQFGYFRWTGPGTSTSLDLLMDKDRNYRIHVDIIDSMGEDITGSLRLSINERPLDTEIVPEGGRLSGHALVNRLLLDKGKEYDRLKLSVNRTVSQAGDQGNRINHNASRECGIAISRIMLIPDR